MSDLSANEQRWRARQIEGQFHSRWVEHCMFETNASGFKIAVDKPRVVLLASQLYLRGFYDQILRGRDKYDFEDPLRGLGVGERLAWFKSQMRSSVNSQLNLF